ncbi:hypothetical protein GCM10011344_42320 [Dokdonia pacifica]|nr:hypothetical protein GCM10011344_42320 [Dokdonia pacifica]
MKSNAQINTTNLESDTQFSQLLENSISILQRAKFSEQVKNLVKKDNLSKSELDFLSKSFGFENGNAYLDYIKNYNTQIKSLQKKYDLVNMDKTELKKISEKVINKTSVAQRMSACERIRRNCLAQAAAGAVVAHLGCATLDITVIAGVICHAAVTIGQAAASDNCNAEAETCANQ